MIDVDKEKKQSGVDHLAVTNSSAKEKTTGFHLFLNYTLLTIARHLYFTNRCTKMYTLQKMSDLRFLPWFGQETASGPTQKIKIQSRKKKKERQLLVLNIYWDRRCKIKSLLFSEVRLKPRSFTA